MRSRFDEQLEQLNTEMIRMGAMCEEVIALAASALVKGDTETASQITPLDKEIDLLSVASGFRRALLLQQQPVARDLRQISAALKMITDMERIGDQAEDIAEIITFLNGRTAEEHSQIREMAKAASKMVTDSVDAYVKHDTELAEQVIAYDDVVDKFFDSVKTNLIGMVSKNPTDGEYALDLLMIAKYFERIGDHATNIAEWVLYSVTGIHKEGQR